ncbi:MAG: NADH-quinone oxidoreductase subunit A, partial [Gammaproteobacteria bacterium]
MLENYLPILLFVIIGIGFGVMPMLAGFILGPRRPDDEKRSVYECGFE